MSYFQGASGTSMQTAIFNEIGGNQITNNYTFRKERERNIYDEFRHIRLGDVEMIRELGDVTFRKFNDFRGDVVISTFTAVVHSGQGSSCTVLSYSGPDAEEQWERDFRQVSGLRNTQMMQLFGINRSNVPLLIFYNELVPLGHVLRGLPILGQAYFRGLARTKFGCVKEQLWIDPKRGTLICGLDGPECGYVEGLELEDVPMSSNIDLLQEDILWRYFSAVKPSDREFDGHVIQVLAEHVRYDHETYFLPDNVRWVSGAHSTLIAPWVSNRWFDDRVLMPDGATRFTLVNVREYSFFQVDNRTSRHVWLSQALAVFHELGISLDEDLTYHFFSVPNLELRGWINGDEAFWQRRHRHGPIYLYILPLLRSTRRRGTLKFRVFWSSDKSGKRQISRGTRRYLGLPRLCVEVDYPFSYSWPIKVYKDVQRWQVARGFDPTTTDFARYLGYPIIDVIQSDTSRFQELDKDLSLDLLFYDTQSTTKETKQSAASKSSSLWSLLTVPFSCEAFEGSDIPAVVI